MSSLTDLDREDCLEKFSLYDVDGTGNLKLSEIIAIVRTLGWHEDDYSEDVIKKMFTTLDTNNDHKISKEEFLEGYKKSFLKDRRFAQLRRTFKKLDTDKSGKLSAEELHKGLKMLGEDVTLEYVKEVVQGFAYEGDQFSIGDFVNFYKNTPRFSKEEK